MEALYARVLASCALCWSQALCNFSEMGSFDQNQGLISKKCENIEKGRVVFFEIKGGDQNGGK